RAKFNIIKDRVEPYKLRHAPAGVLAVTAGVDTQDSRLAAHITGWGRGMASWTLDYVELPGDPESGEVWNSLVELLSQPIEHEWGGVLHVLATAIDAGGHRTTSVKDFVRSRRITRPMCIFGSPQNNAPPLGKGKLEDVKASGRSDRRGLLIYQVGTVAIKHQLYARLSTDHDKQSADRLVHLSEELDDFYLNGLVSEVYNPKKNRFEKKTGVRNEPLDTYTYSFAAAHHPELRLHLHKRNDWDKREQELREMARPGAVQAATARLAAARAGDEQDEGAAPALGLDGRRNPVPMPAPLPSRRSGGDDADLFAPISMIG
ncbi:MAG: phage terminase large subunit family protein, partial [Methyloversatilis sp.]|nr:phage terminase large subunit family protein [Methyloversatilis sp.]